MLKTKGQETALLSCLATLRAHEVSFIGFQACNSFPAVTAIYLHTAM